LFHGGAAAPATGGLGGPLMTTSSLTATIGTALGVPTIATIFYTMVLSDAYHNPSEAAIAPPPPEITINCVVNDIYDTNAISDPALLDKFIQYWGEEYDESLIKEKGEEVVERAIAKGWNPALVLAIWGEETHFSDYGERIRENSIVREGADWGCGVSCGPEGADSTWGEGNKPGTFEESVTCFLRENPEGCNQQCGDPSTNRVEFDTFTDCYRPPENNPGFKPVVLQMYQQLDPGGITCEAASACSANLSQTATTMSEELGTCGVCDGSVSDENNDAEPPAECYCPPGNIPGAGMWCTEDPVGPDNYHCWNQSEESDFFGGYERYYTQCTEFIDRIYEQTTGMSAYTYNGDNLGNAGQWYENANPDKWIKFKNEKGNARFLQPGDIVVFSDSRFGHVSIVTEMGPFNKTVKVAHANVATKTTTFKIDDDDILRWGDKFPAFGFLRHRCNQ